MVPENASLEGLPDELLLEVLVHLSTIRSFETQSTIVDKSEERARQRENRLRQLSLFNLCRTSRHLNRLAIPALYTAFTGFSTGSPGKVFTYASHLQYVENRFTDDQGNNLFANLNDPGELYVIKKYLSLLAGVINSAPNLQHINVTSTETHTVSFWKHVIDEKHLGAPRFTLLAGHGLSQLETLCIETNFDEYDDAEATESLFDSICSAMASVPSLSDIRATGVMATGCIAPKMMDFG